MRLAIITTVSILVFFGLVFCGLYGYRKYKASRRPKECIIQVLRDGSLRVNGKPIKPSELADFLKRQAKKRIYDKSPMPESFLMIGSSPAFENWRFDDPGSSSLDTAHALLKKQPFTPRFEVDPDCLFQHVHENVICSDFRPDFSWVDISLKDKNAIHLFHCPDRRRSIGAIPTIDLQEVRVKLLWYSPNGRPRYLKEDGKFILKITGRVFGSLGNPDWEEMAEYIKRKAKEYRPPSSLPEKRLPVIIDARKYVPAKHVFKALESLQATKSCGNISIAAPEIPY